MPRRYIIDGYNLLMRWHRGKIKSGPGNLERARMALLQWIERHVDDDHEVVAVFDSPRATLGQGAGTSSRIRVVFAHEHNSADEWIIEECAKPGDRAIVVVSNDWQVQTAARRAKVEVCSSDEFIAELSTPSKASPDRLGTPHETAAAPAKEQPKLSDAELARFREAMADHSRKPNPEDSPRSPTTLRPESGDPASAELDLADFYREMRDSNFEGYEDP